MTLVDTEPSVELTVAPAATVLTLHDLEISIRRGDDWVPAVTGVSLDVLPGEALGIVGESGCGKSLTLCSMIDLLPRGTRVSGGEIGRTVHGRPTRVGMVFQDALSALNPTRRVGDLIADGILANGGTSRRAARQRAVELLADVGVPDPRRRAQMWPHELSGGLRQRVMIAMALGTEPDVLLCDEPTTALDVTVQDQILGLLDRLRRERGMAIVFVTHDLGVVATLCQRLVVLYAGQVVESGTIHDVTHRPRHAYTAALLRSAVGVEHQVESFRPIGGQPPDPAEFGDGCRFADRCELVEAACRTTPWSPVEIEPDHLTTCLRARDVEPAR